MIERMRSAVRPYRDAPWKVRRHLLRLAFQPVIRVWVSLLGVELQPGVMFFGKPIIRVYRGSCITIGSRSLLRSSQTSNVLGVSRPVMLTTLSSRAVIKVGPAVGLSGVSIAAMTQVVIGARTQIGADVIITDTDHHQFEGSTLIHDLQRIPSRSVCIGEDVFIGARAIILKGSTIGAGAIVGAGAVVSGPVEGGTIVAGNPARVVGRVASLPEPSISNGGNAS